MNAVQDEIRRSIDIHAPLEIVWELVSEPGWWVNNGALGGHRLEHEGSTCFVHDDELGTFPIGIEELDPPHRAVFTWLAGDQTDDESVESLPSTRIRFDLDESSPGTVTLTVVESGFAAMTVEQRERNFEDNVSGWELEIALARDALEDRVPEGRRADEQGSRQGSDA